jgi:hydrogenase nickel incorporation protein HypA/HybF
VHELSLASAIVDTVERHAGGRAVTVIALRVGTLRQVVPESLELYVDLVGRGTVCEGARLEVEVVPATLACCGGEWEPPGFRCAQCGGGGRVVAGDEFLVESIDVREGWTGRSNAEQEEVEACIART